MKKVVQIIPIALETDRFIELIRRFPPHKVYFVEASSKSQFRLNHPKEISALEAIIGDLMKLLPLAEIERVKIIQEDFVETFTSLLKIMLSERKAGNEVVINLVGGSRILTCAAAFAASISDSTAYYVVAQDYNPPGSYVLTRGTVGDPIPVPSFPVHLPNGIDAQILTYLLKHDGCKEKKLATIAQDLGLKALGLTSVQSGIVKLSIHLKVLQEHGLVTVTRSTGRRLALSLTESGELIAKILEIMIETPLQK